MRTRLTENFWLEEFLVSETAARHGIDMTPPPEVRANIERLAKDVLQPMRKRLSAEVGRDVPIIITSGYRPPELNRLVGGSPTSQHMRGEAADIRGIGIVPSDLWLSISSMNLPIEQLILEFDSWVHVSVSPVDRLPARQFLSAVRRNGRTVYLTGLHRE